MPQPLTLTQALVRYDRRQAEAAAKRGRYYNPHALGIYLQRAADIEADIARGADPRAAIIAGFTDRLRDFVLKNMGLPITTAEELRSRNDGRITYQPVTR